MVASMLGAGRLANVMARADACMPLGTSMRVSGKKIYGMGREAASMLQGTSTKACMLLNTCTGSVCQCCAMRTQLVLNQIKFNFEC